MDSSHSVLRSAKSFFAGTLVSRLLGLGRDVAMAFCFGSAPEVAAFMVAYRLANLFRRLLGEGNLQAGFVPEFTRQGEVEQAVGFYRDVFYSLAGVSAALAGGGALVCWGLSAFFASDIPLMTAAIFPGVIFLCLYALNAAVLQCQRRYFLSALAPAAFNGVWIVAAFALWGCGARMAMFGLSFAVAGAFACQYAITRGPIRTWMRGVKKERVRLFSEPVRRLLKPLSFGIVGIGAAQINSALDALFARWADLSGPAYLWYAIRIQQLPLALFGIALAGALLPPLSRAVSEGAVERYRSLLGTSLRQSAALMVPCAVGMAVLAPAGLDLLYGHGGFTLADGRETEACLRGYALGLVPMVYVLLLANGFYAKKEYAVPMRCSLWAVGCNVALNALFVFGFGWGAKSIAIATSLSAVLNCVLLARETKGLCLWLCLCKIGLCSAAAGALCVGVDGLFAHPRALGAQLARFVIDAGVYGGAVFGFAALLRVKELFELLKMKRGAVLDSAPME